MAGLDPAIHMNVGIISYMSFAERFCQEMTADLMFVIPGRVAKLR
jgi:hypothetical protein